MGLWAWALHCARGVRPAAELFYDRPWRCRREDENGRRCVRRHDHEQLDTQDCLFYFTEQGPGR